MKSNIESVSPETMNSLNTNDNCKESITRTSRSLDNIKMLHSILGKLNIKFVNGFEGEIRR